MVMGTFRSTETNFWSISTHEGSIHISDTVLVHLHWSQTESDVKKTVSTEYFVSTDRARTLISELSQGTLETKRTLKWALEGVRRTRNKRVERESSRRPT